MSILGRKRNPTKIFCIGFHKTGTSSLGQALRRLGFSVCGAVEVQNLHLRENVGSIIARHVARYDAFEDNPWPVLYNELDELYPGSKFILTWREPADWIRSVVGHFGGTSTPMREWIYGYGDPEGHESNYLDRYVRHQSEVLAHFDGREKDFMVLKIMEGEGWERVCPFLGVPIPSNLPFPHQNRRDQSSDRAGR